MPSPEQINSMCARLPMIGKYEKPRGEKVWAVTERGGHFRLYRHTDTLADIGNERWIPANCVTVSISGTMLVRELIADDFISALGMPTHITEKTTPSIKKDKTYLTWKKPI